MGASQIAAYTPLHAAKKLGYFEEEGPRRHGRGRRRWRGAVAAGGPGHAADRRHAAQHRDRGGAQEGLELALIPSPTYQAKSEAPGQTATLVSKDSDIKTLKDLEGKKVAINVINSVNWLYNRAMLDKAGVDLERITYVEVPFPNMMDALKNGSVDAIVEVQPFVYLAETVGNARVLAYDFLETQPGVKITAYAASRAWADEHPNAIAAVQRALAPGRRVPGRQSGGGQDARGRVHRRGEGAD